MEHRKPIQAGNQRGLPASGLLYWIKRGRLGRLANSARTLLHRMLALVKIPPPDAPQLLQRIELMERDIILPLKAAGVAMLLYSFYFRPWIGRVLSALDIAVQSTQYLFWVYVAINLVVTGLLFRARQVPLAVVEWAVFIICLVDGVFLSSLTLVTGGYDSILYWLFLALIMRSAVSVPRAASQLMLNLTLSACYVLSGVVALAVVGNLPEDSRQASGLSEPMDNPAEPLLLRVFLLLLMTVCSYGVQVLLERQRLAEEEMREFAAREGQLRSAGRLAAEIAHQIKNPLAIINNAAFSLQKALKQGKTDVREQISIIQEEVDRSDRIITQIMGYAQLAEGRVERVNVAGELDLAIDRVFPPAAGYPVIVRREYGETLPPLLMQRRHVAEIFVNVLQNAREAIGTRGGTITVAAECLPDQSIQVGIQDDGPGIQPDRLERVFEAYYTTKEKGTGLGLSTVKHNVELYGGRVHVESELGKGAEFKLFFPAKTFVRMEKSI